jgi:pimeloyl-ACP methyl ester carboxylesterase
MPGFGLSAGDAQVMRPSAQGEFAIKVLDHFGIEKIHGIGPDVGVPVMLWLAEHHPERIESLVVMGGPGFYPPYVSMQLRALMKSNFVRGLIAQEGIRFAEIAIRRGYNRYEPTAEALNEYREFNRDPQRFGLTLDFLASYPAELTVIGERLESISCPVLALWGSKDPFVKSENGYEFSRRIPNCRFELIPNCGHYAHEDAGMGFVERLRRWCAEVSEPVASSGPKLMA